MEVITELKYFYVTITLKYISDHTVFLFFSSTCSFTVKSELN